jgi:hypothetical protein
MRCLGEADLLAVWTSDKWDLKPYHSIVWDFYYRGADKSLARTGRKEATATEDFEFHTSYL